MSDRAEIDASALASEDKTLPMATYVLYLLSIVTGGITGIVGLILAYANRATSGPIAHSHYTFLIRTFWIGLGVSFISVFLIVWGAIFSIILIGIPFLLLGKLTITCLFVWFVLRSVVGLIHLSRDEAYPRPYSWLV